uniref:IMD domain-containing protein n=1 Tax=Salarias fasciatus TaxID=181472 RepID=A0A672GJE4_SALFA
ERLVLLEETEKQAVRRALLEERGRFCGFVAMLRPVLEEEMSLLGDVSHLQTLTEDLKTLTMDPHKLPPSSEQVILDLKSSDCSWSYQTPPSSPSATVSRKSSMCSSLNSVTSSDSRSSGSHCPSPSGLFRHRASSSSSSAPPQQTPARLSSVSSHDSGFLSQDAFQSKSPSPMPPDSLQVPNPPAGLLPVCVPLDAALAVRLRPHVHMSLAVFGFRVLQDWARPGPYDQLGGNTLRSSSVQNPEEPPGVKGHAETSPRGDRAAHEELARVLARGLRLDLQSLQGSSGYSSQTNTPCCSEDAAASQVSDCDYCSIGGDPDGEPPPLSDVDKSSAVPPPYRHMFQSRRPASAAGSSSAPSAAVTPGVATIRRTPSSKPNLRRPPGGLSLGPIPIKPPMIPVKTPTVPEHPAFPCSAPQPPPGPPATPAAAAPRGVPWEVKHRAEAPDPPGGRRRLPELPEEVECGEAEDYLAAIRRGVRLRKTSTDDRSAPAVR